jgi:replicative DNA helicase
MEKTILSHLVYNEDYGRQVIPFLKEDYFHNRDEKLVFKLINEYSKKFNSFPTKEALFIDLQNVTIVSEQEYNDTKECIRNLEIDPSTKLEWLLDNTEKFCQNKAVYNAIRESISIIDNKSNQDKGSIPKILEDALQVSFDTSVGHDYLDDSDSRYDYYHSKVDRVPFDINLLNTITNGGLPIKTLSVFLAGVNVGKTQLMCHMAANNLRDGKNVLYITLEMSQEEIAKRVDSNLLDISMDDLLVIPRDVFNKRMDRLKQTTKGKLKIKEYPTSQAGASNFRHLINELEIKKKFSPDIIYIDYINICCSSRIKRGQANSYEYIKAIAEELRGLAVETAVPIVSATQLNRTGFQSSDVGLEDTAESFGLPATADFMCALISTEELEEMNQIMVKQLKNRLASKQTNKRFVIGVDRQKMRFYDVEDQAQEDLIDGPIMDRGKFMEEDTERNKPKPKFDKMRFKGFK